MDIVLLIVLWICSLLSAKFCSENPPKTLFQSLLHYAFTVISFAISFIASLYLFFGFTNWVPEWWMVLVLSLVPVVIGVLLGHLSKKKREGSNPAPHKVPQQQ